MLWIPAFAGMTQTH